MLRCRVNHAEVELQDHVLVACEPDYERECLYKSKNHPVQNSKYSTKAPLEEVAKKCIQYFTGMTL